MPKRCEKNPTRAEDVLWRALQNRYTARLKFRRQHCIGPFIADFYCPSLKLIIEVDGSIHDQPFQQQKDLRRDMWCEQNGFHVLRFSNDQVIRSLDAVLETITVYAGLYPEHDWPIPPIPTKIFRPR